jgi:hypothetical protein
VQADGIVDAAHETDAGVGLFFYDMFSRLLVRCIILQLCSPVKLAVWALSSYLRSSDRGA